MTRERAYLVLEALTGENRRTPEHVAELGKAANALEEVKKNGVAGGKREDILSAARQLTLLGEDVKDDSPLGQQIKGLFTGNLKTGTAPEDPEPENPPAGNDPPAGGPDDPGPDTSGGGSSWTQVATIDPFTDSDGVTHHATLWRHDDGTIVYEHWTTDPDGNTTSHTCDEGGNDTVECPDFDAERPTDDQVVCDGAACERGLRLIAALTGDPATEPCAQQACPELGGDGWGGPVDVDGDGKPELARWLINTFGGVYDPSPLDDGAGAVVTPDHFDPCAANACPEFGPGGPEAIEPSGPVGDPRDPSPIFRP